MAFDHIRNLIVANTKADEFLAVLASGLCTQDQAVRQQDQCHLAVGLGTLDLATEYKSRDD